MPRKIRQLIADLRRAGFVDRGGKGSHRNFQHPLLPKVKITLSGSEGQDALWYQEKEVREAIEQMKLKQEE